MEIDSVHADSEGTAPCDSSSASSRRDRFPSEIKFPHPKEDIEKAVPNTRNQLRDCLNNFHDGLFATSSALPDAANSGIFVQSVGLVGLPLSSRDAEAIIDIVHKDQVHAEYPASTVSLPTGSLNLMPGQFEIQNPVWQQTLAEAIEERARALGLKNQIQDIRAEIAQLRICCPNDSVNDQQQ